MLLSACVDTYTPDIDLLRPRLDISGELTTDNYVSVHISTSFGDQTMPITPDSHGEVSAEINDSRLNYESSTGMFVNQFTFPKPGDMFELKVELTDSDIPAIYSSVTIPYPGQIQYTKVISEEEVPIDENYSHFHLEIEMALANPPDAHTFYHILPKQMPDGHAKPVGDLEAFVIDRILTGANAGFKINHKDGILVDISKLGEGNVLSFTMDTKTPVDKRVEIFTRFMMQLNTVSSEYYNYHKAIDKQLDSNDSPIKQPAVTYTNIENGYGLFGGVSVVRDTVQIR